VPAFRKLDAVAVLMTRLLPAPRVTEDLAELADPVTGFAARERLTIVPAVPQHDYGPEVCLGPAVLDLPRFLELACDEDRYRILSVT